MKLILALCLAFFLVAIHAAALPKKSLQLKMYKNSQKAVKPRYFMCYNLFFSNSVFRPKTYGNFNKRHLLAQANASLGDFFDDFYVVSVTLGTPGLILLVKFRGFYRAKFRCRDKFTLLKPLKHHQI